MMVMMMMMMRNQVKTERTGIFLCLTRQITHK